MSVTEPDVIIVGGGPAGVSCAFTLAKLGKSVVIVDKKKHSQIGNKTCGDALDMESPVLLHEALGLELPRGDEISDKVTKMTVKTESVEITLSAPGYVVDRHIYGQRLLQDCIDIGVEVISDAPVRGVIIEENYVKGIKYRKDGEVHELRAKLVADCSGTLGVVRRQLPEGFSDGMYQTIPDHHIAASFREIVKLKEDHPYPEEIVLAYFPSIPPPGYLWFFSKGDKRLNIGTGWLKSENKLIDKPMKQIYRAALDDYYKLGEDYEVEITGGGQIPIRPPYDCLTFNGGVVIGDAACQVDPTTAEGHGPAMVCGYYAGKAIVKALDAEDVSRENLWDYNMDVMAHYGRRNAISYVTLQFLRDVEADGMNFLLTRKVLTEEEVKAVYDGQDPDTGFISVLLKLIRCFPRYGLLKKMYTLVSAVKKMGTIYDEYPKNPADLSNWRERRNTLLGENL
ncbi:MAG: NAD(P)/FAD-dependent oxidoreductase [Candidatus Heimdallarchaeota archaeon]|nr:NAD(P)/FAD-dependent oxidoreductase [Candidatus Heimdallarchaeota archaeon]